MVRDVILEPDEHDNTLTELQGCASNPSDTIAALEASVERSSMELKKEKCEDLEAHSRRNNVKGPGMSVFHNIGRRYCLWRRSRLSIE